MFVRVRRSKKMLCWHPKSERETRRHTRQSFHSGHGGAATVTECLRARCEMGLKWPKPGCDQPTLAESSANLLTCLLLVCVLFVYISVYTCCCYCCLLFCANLLTISCTRAPRGGRTRRRRLASPRRRSRGAWAPI